MAAGDTEIRYGYTLRDLHQLTAAAVKADRSMAMDYSDRWDIAWSTIAEHLCAAPHWPNRQDLIRAGWQGIYAAVREEYRQHGYADRTSHTGHASAPRFVRYWYNPVQPSHEDRIVEGLALGQVLAPLPDTYRDALAALAVHGDYMLAAEALGISYKALVARIGVARRRVLGLWHEHETPYRPRRTDRRVESHSSGLAIHCGRGHEWTPENSRTRVRTVRGRTKTERVCRSCERERDALKRRRAA